MPKNMGKSKKKKGRPSLLDLQKRSLKLNNNNLTINSNLSINSNNIINTHNNNNNNNITINSNNNNNNEGNSGDDRDNSNSGCSDFTPAENKLSLILRKGKIDYDSTGSAADNDDVEKRKIAVINKANNEKGEKERDDGPSTPLPDRKLLLFIVDSLQKKDTYGVFANPVDPEELPDYHDIVKNPMDYSTLRKKLEDGAYGSLEQFEKDIFLICSNAMLYNAPDSIYFRQARSMQELAIKNFDNLRQESGDDNEIDPEPKIARRGRPPTKHLKRPRGRPPLERPTSKFSEANLAASGGSTNRLNEHKKGPSHPEKYGSNGSLAKTLFGSRKNEAHVQAERSDDMIGSASKGYSVKHWKKQIVIDESRRNTYQTSASRREPSVLNTFKGERKQLIAVGLHTEYGYARSLSRFAAKLGPVAWKVASKRIERCLPTGVKYGQGWVGENGTPSERVKQQLPDASDLSSVAVTPPQGLVKSRGEMSEQKPQVKQLSEIQMPSSHPKSNNESPTQPRINGVNGNYEPNFANQMGKMIEAAKHPSVAAASSSDDSHDEKAKLSVNSIPVNNGHQPKVATSPPDLNVGFQSPGSSGSMQPDLALQL